MGRLNRRALFARLQRLGRASRAELAKSLGMSQPTAGKIVDDLIAQGLVEEVAGRSVSEPFGPRGRGWGKGRIGRPGRLLQPSTSQPRFLAVQLGVEQTHVAGLPAAAPSVDAWDEAFPTVGGAEAWAQALERAAGRWVKHECWGVLVSIPGIVDEVAGQVLYSPNLHWTEGTDLRRLLRDIWGVSVVVVQEERALALGQLAFDESGEDFLLVDFGDGVGAAAVVGGRLYESPLPISGELGHTPIMGNRRACGCGAVGCVETLVSRRGLLESFAEDAPAGKADWSALQGLVRQSGLPGWLEAAVEAAGGAIAGALNVLGVRRVLVTGTLADLGQTVTDRLARSVRGGAMWARFGQVDCCTVPRRRAAGLVSAGIDRLVLPTGDTARPMSCAILSEVS